jgi:predicted secreted protein
MALKSGNAGAVKISTNTVLEIDKWTANFGFNFEDTASFGDTWEEKAPNLGKWSGSFSGRYDPADTNGHVALRTAALAGTTVALRLYEDATKYYSGTAFIEAAYDVSVTDQEKVTYTFTGTGAPSYV